MKRPRQSGGIGSHRLTRSLCASSVWRLCSIDSGRVRARFHRWKPTRFTGDDCWIICTWSWPTWRRSERFYKAVLATLEIPIGGKGPGFFWADELFISSADSVAARAVNSLVAATSRFKPSTRMRSRRSTEAGLAAGGTDNGPPGARPYHPGYYAAFLLDPDGNNVEAVYHGPHERSVDAVKITF